MSALLLRRLCSVVGFVLSVVSVLRCVCRICRISVIDLVEQKHLYYNVSSFCFFGSVKPPNHCFLVLFFWGSLGWKPPPFPTLPPPRLPQKAKNNKKQEIKCFGDPVKPHHCMSFFFFGVGETTKSLYVLVFFVF